MKNVRDREAAAPKQIHYNAFDDNITFYLYHEDADPEEGVRNIHDGGVIITVGVESGIVHAVSVRLPLGMRTTCAAGIYGLTV